MSRRLAHIVQTVFAFSVASCGAQMDPDSSVIFRTAAWETELDVGNASADLLDEETLIFSGYALNSAALDTSEPTLIVGRLRLESGEVLWERSMLPRVGSPSFARADDVLIVLRGSAVEALDITNGQYLWGATFEATPSRVTGGRDAVVIVLEQGIVNARDSRSGRSLWTIDTEDWRWQSFHETGGRLYAIADNGDEVAIFDANYPSATPLWSASVRGGASTTWTSGATVYGRFDGVALHRVAITDGETIGDPIDQPNGWVGGLRLVSTEVQGLILRMQRIEAYTPEDDMEPVWSTILPSGNPFDSIESVLDGEAIFLRATGLSILLNARDGSVAWQTTESGADGSSDRCSTVGTTGHALIRGCGSFSTTRVVAVEIAE